METFRDIIQPRVQPRAVKAQPAFRSPRRITITVPYGTYQRLLERSEQEGRSLSNLAAHLLENAMDQS